MHALNIHRYLPSAALALALLIGPACQRGHEPGTEHRFASNRWMIETYSNESIEQAILVEQTLYPHHFVTGAPTLNSLGEHDLTILATYHREHPGTINIRQGEADDQLYEQRLAAVERHLSQAGVDTATVTLADDLPGGLGRPSYEPDEQALEGLEGLEDL
ncbi:MAG: hypothetical protein WD118_11565 [Phycisphaeraceae bacterium]